MPREVEMDYMVLYASVTGNTKKIATEIFSALPGMSKDMQNIEEYRGKEDRKSVV